MAKRPKPLPVKLYVRLTTRTPEILDEVIEALIAKYGDVDFRTAPLEDGNELAGERPPPSPTRKLVSFERLVDPGKLARYGKASLRIERELLGRPRSRREPPVRISPGYVTSAIVVASSTKNATHRIYLGQGIYGEVSHVLHDGRLQPNPWTPSEDASPPALHFLQCAWQRYLEQVQLVPPDGTGD